MGVVLKNFHFGTALKTRMRTVPNLKMGEFGGQNAHSTLNTDCESGV